MTVLALPALALTAPVAVAAQAADPGGQFSATALAAPPTKVTAAYSCDLSAYAGTTPVTLSGTFSIPPTVVADSTVDITLATTAGTLTPAEVTALTGVTTFDIATTLTAKETLKGVATPIPGTVALTGAATAPTTLTTLPVMTATGSVDFSVPFPGSKGFPVSGTGAITVPAALTITPQTSTAAKPVISCATTTTSQDVKVTVTPETVGTTGPLYKCTLTEEGALLDTQFVHVVSTITTSGTATTGKTLTVTYKAPIFTPIFWAGASSVTYAGSLPVTGAQTGNVSLDESVDVTKPLSVSGKLPLTKAGTDHIEVPKKFTIEMSTSTATVDFTCTLTTTSVPVGRTIAVKGATTHPHPRPTVTVTATVTTTPNQGVEGGGTPSGAPETGGGIGSVGGGLGMALAGLGIAGAGGGLVFGGWRIRRRRAS
jgi:hypothetical protein